MNKISHFFAFASSSVVILVFTTILAERKLTLSNYLIIVSGSFIGVSITFLIGQLKSKKRSRQ